jgi:hypothetical protein
MRSATRSAMRVAPFGSATIARIVPWGGAAVAVAGMAFDPKEARRGPAARVRTIVPQARRDAGA